MIEQETENRFGKMRYHINNFYYHLKESLCHAILARERIHMAKFTFVNEQLNSDIDLLETFIECIEEDLIKACSYAIKDNERLSEIKQSEKGK